MTQAEQFNDLTREAFQSRIGFHVDQVPRQQLAAIEDYLDPAEREVNENNELVWTQESIAECINRLAEAAAGLTWQEAKSAFTISYQTSNHLNVRDVQAQKITFLNSHPALTVHHPDNLPSFADVGGYSAVCEYLRMHMSVYAPENKERVADLGLGTNAVKGCLFLGIPGNGKSLVARAIAKEFDMMACDFDLGAVMDKYVGGSESNIRRAIEIMEKAAGNRGLVVVMDEVEKQLAGMSNAGASDAGASTRVHRTLLSWLQDRKKPVVIFMTANAIDQVPPEFMRPGRVDTIWFFDLPSADERIAIFRVHLNKFPKIPKEIDIEDAATNLLKGFTGAEIEQLVKECALAVFCGKASTIDEELIRSVTCEFKLQCNTHADAISSLRKRAESFRRANNPESCDKPVVESSVKPPRTLRQWKSNVDVIDIEETGETVAPVVRKETE